MYVGFVMGKLKRRRKFTCRVKRKFLATMKINIHDAVAAERAGKMQEYFPLLLLLPHPLNAHENHEK